MMKPMLSVLIDTYNQERYIEQSVLSAIDQDFPTEDYEIVVVDDGSTDLTPEIVEKIVARHPRGANIRLLRKKNGGQASAFNAAFPELRGRIVSFLDGDDWWAEKKLTAVAEAFEANPGIAAVGHAYYEVNDAGCAREVVTPATICQLEMSSADAARLAGCGIALLGTSRLSVRRELLNRIGAIPEELVFCADTPIIAFAVALGGAVILDRPLCYYRLHSGNLCAPGHEDTAKLRWNLRITDIFLKYITERLVQFGIPLEFANAFFESIRIEHERTKFRTGEENGRRKVCRLEWERFRACYERPSIGYLLFQLAVCASALVLPPRHFYQLLEWYGRKNLRRFRDILGKPQPKVPPSLFERHRLSAAKELDLRQGSARRA